MNEVGTREKDTSPMHTMSIAYARIGMEIE